MNMGMGTTAAAAVGVAILETAEARRRAAAARAREQEQVVHEWVNATDGLEWHRPEGPGYGSVLLPEGTDDLGLVETLHERRGVLVVPGSLFEEPGTLRVSWLQAGTRLEEGLSIVAEAVRSR
jgi:aspartate/methionine/tyrosine aminotransferase